MIETDNFGHAVPGPWHRRFYLPAWNRAFPESAAHPGRFYDGNKWASSTPSWDEWWFENSGVKPPRQSIVLPANRQAAE